LNGGVEKSKSGAVCDIAEPMVAHDTCAR